MIIDTAYKIKVMQAYLDGKPIEFFNGYLENWEVWESDLEPVWSWLGTSYRVKELTKPSINWDEVSDEYNWLACDGDGRVYLYEHPPEIDEESGVWCSNCSFTNASAFKSFIKGNCDWEESLIQRPQE